jgi:hypothetical protein
VYNPSQLTPEQLDGLACVVCGLGFTTTVPSRPVGHVDGCQVFACTSHDDTLPVALHIEAGRSVDAAGCPVWCTTHPLPGVHTTDVAAFAWTDTSGVEVTLARHHDKPAVVRLYFHTAGDVEVHDVTGRLAAALGEVIAKHDGQDAIAEALILAAAVLGGGQ